MTCRPSSALHPSPLPPPNSAPPPSQVPFAACLARLSDEEVLEDYQSAALGGRRSQAAKTSRFASFPPYLVMALRR